MKALGALSNLGFGGKSPYLALLGMGVALAAATGFALGTANPRLLLDAAGAGAMVLLLFFPEFALALYVIVGDVKGDDRVAALLPIDWTIALGVVLIAGIALNALRGRRVATMPPAYFLLGALSVWMTFSLCYTPVFEAGAEKLGRFLIVTGIAIVAPFFVLGTRRAMKQFLAAFGVAAFAICAYSLLGLGSQERLASPSDNTIGLGHVACALVMLIWFAVIPRDGLPLRLVSYALLIVPMLALMGSGSRGSAIACALAVGASLFFFRRRLLEVIAVGAVGLLALPFLGIPDASLDYLGTIVKTGSVDALLDFRSDLLGYGWELLQKHPLIGAGIDGFQYSSPNAGVYKWPHNIFLEVACELGIPALLLVIAFFAWAARESLRQLRDTSSPHRLLFQLGAAWLLLGVVNGLNTGDINSDRTTWLFASIVFVMGSYGASGHAALPEREIEAAAQPALA